MSTKHTPGPWYVQGTNPPHIYARDGLDIVAQCDSSWEMARAQEAANARLIAAAPDLLAALEMTLAYLRREWAKAHSEDVGSAMRAVRSAIAKATGNE